MLKQMTVEDRIREIVGEIVPGDVESSEYAVKKLAAVYDEFAAKEQS